jgi:hypothetical protein
MRGVKPRHSTDEWLGSAPVSSARSHASPSPLNAAAINAGIVSGSSKGRNDVVGGDGGGSGDEGEGGDE